MQSSNIRRKSGGVVILKLASILLALTIVVCIHVGKESEETEYIEEEELSKEVICIDDPQCVDYIAQVGNLRASSTSCNEPIGILNEQHYQKLLEHYCRRSCGLCGSGIADEEEGVSDAVIRAEVIEVTQEIEEKEIEDEIEREEEEQELENENATEIEEQEKEFTNNDESKEIISETSIVEDAINSSSQLTNTTFVGKISLPIDYKIEESMMNSNVVEDTSSKDKVVIEEEVEHQSEIPATANTLPQQSSTIQYPLEQTQTAKLLSHQPTAIPKQSLPIVLQQQQQLIENTPSIVNREQDSKEATPLGNVTEIQDGNELVNAMEVEDDRDEVVAANIDSSSINNLADELPQGQASLIVQQPPPPITQPQMEPPIVTEPLYQSSNSELANIGGYNNIPGPTYEPSPNHIGIDLPNVGGTISDTP